MKEKILVLGGNGLLGTHLQKVMPDAMYPVRGIIGDLRIKKYIHTALYDYKPSVIVLLAARVGGIFDNKSHPVSYLEDNVLINTNVISVAHEFNIKKLIAVSSSCVYPEHYESYPMKECSIFDGRPEPTNASYAYAKRCMMMQLEAYRKEYNRDYCCIIPSNLYGFDKASGNKQHFVTALIDKIIEAKKKGKKSIQLFGSGKPLRQFLYAQDAARLIKNMIDDNIYKDINIGAPENISIASIARIALKACNAEELKIKWVEGPDGVYRKDISNDRLLKYWPKFHFTKLEYGIKKMYDWKISNDKIN